MSKKIKIILTEAQLIAIVGLTDEISSSIGGGYDDTERKRWVKLIDRMLNNNGYRRKFK